MYAIRSYYASVIEENLQLTRKGGTFNIFGGPPAGHKISDYYGINVS